MDDKDLEFSALMEGLGGEELIAQLEAAAQDEAKPSDETVMIMGHVATIGQLRQLRDAFRHVWDHSCEWGASVLMQWAALTLREVVPFLVWLDGGDPASHEESDDRPDGGVQSCDEGSVEMGDKGDDVQD